MTSPTSPTFPTLAAAHAAGWTTARHRDDAIDVSAQDPASGDAVSVGYDYELLDHAGRPTGVGSVSVRLTEEPNAMGVPGCSIAMFAPEHAPVRP